MANAATGRVMLHGSVIVVEGEVTYGMGEAETGALAAERTCCLQKAYPGFADAGLAVRQTLQEHGPVVWASLRNTVSASGSGMLPTN